MDFCMHRIKIIIDNSIPNFNIEAEGKELAMTTSKQTNTQANKKQVKKRQTKKRG